MGQIDQTINEALRPFSDALSRFIFYEVTVFGISFAWIVMWLIVAAVFFTVY